MATAGGEDGKPAGDRGAPPTPKADLLGEGVAEGGRPLDLDAAADAAEAAAFGDFWLLQDCRRHTADFGCYATIRATRGSLLSGFTRRRASRRSTKRQDFTDGFMTAISSMPE